MRTRKTFESLFMMSRDCEAAAHSERKENMTGEPQDIKVGGASGGPQGGICTFHLLDFSHALSISSLCLSLSLYLYSLSLSLPTFMHTHSHDGEAFSPIFNRNRSRGQKSFKSEKTRARLGVAVVTIVTANGHSRVKQPLNE